MAEREVGRNIKRATSVKDSESYNGLNQEVIASMEKKNSNDENMKCSPLIDKTIRIIFAYHFKKII